MIISDSKSAKNTDTAENKGFDGGYTGENFANNVKALIGVEVEVVKRSFGWLEDYRLLWKNCERKIFIMRKF